MTIILNHIRTKVRVIWSISIHIGVNLLQPCVLVKAQSYCCA